MAVTNSDRIRELERNLSLLQAEGVHLRQLLTDATATNRDGEMKRIDLERELALVKQRLDDHMKRMEVWSGRLWGFITLLVGTVLSLASGLIVTLARKSSEVRP